MSVSVPLSIWDPSLHVYALAVTPMADKWVFQREEFIAYPLWCFRQCHRLWMECMMTRCSSRTVAVVLWQGKKGDPFQHQMLSNLALWPRHWISEKRFLLEYTFKSQHLLFVRLMNMKELSGIGNKGPSPRNSATIAVAWFWYCTSSVFKWMLQYPTLPMGKSGAVSWKNSRPLFPIPGQTLLFLLDV